MTGDEKKSMVSMLNQALKNPLSEWFRLAGVSSLFSGLEVKAERYFSSRPRCSWHPSVF